MKKMKMIFLDLNHSIYFDIRINSIPLIFVTVEVLMFIKIRSTFRVFTRILYFIDEKLLIAYNIWSILYSLKTLPIICLANTASKASIVQYCEVK